MANQAEVASVLETVMRAHARQILAEVEALIDSGRKQRDVQAWKYVVLDMEPTIRALEWARLIAEAVVSRVKVEPRPPLTPLDAVGLNDGSEADWRDEPPTVVEDPPCYLCQSKDHGAIDCPHDDQSESA